MTTTSGRSKKTSSNNTLPLSAFVFTEHGSSATFISISLHLDIVMSIFAALKEKDVTKWGNFPPAKPRAPRRNNWDSQVRCGLVHVYVLQLAFDKWLPKWATLYEVSRVILTRLSLKRCLCGLSSFFSALQEKHAADLCELLQKHRGVGGNSIPSGCSGRLSPIVSAGPTLSSFSWLKYWPKFWSQGNDSCWLNISYIFLFAILWLHSLLVMSQVKSKSLVSAEESA